MDDSTFEELAQKGVPTNRQQLDQRVAAVGQILGVAPGRVRVFVSSIVVAQMLPAGCLIKGGVGLKLRLGEIGTRATKDVDVVARDRGEFLPVLAGRLRTGWGAVPPSKGALKRDPSAPPRVAFTGTVREGRRSTPQGVPPGYVMQPHRVTLSFLGTEWAAVPVEVVHDELDGLDLAETPARDAGQVDVIGKAFGFGDVAPVPVISLEQQIAQKIHALTEPGSTRVHDLVDLQILWGIGTDAGHGLDLLLLEKLCRRTFAYRDTHVWPPSVELSPLLAPAYVNARDEAVAGRPAGAIPILPILTDAAAWLGDRILQVSLAGADPTDSVNMEP